MSENDWEMGKGTKTEKFSERIQVAFDPAPSFHKIMLQIFIVDTKLSKLAAPHMFAFMQVGMRAR